MEGAEFCEGGRRESDGFMIREGEGLVWLGEIRMVSINLEPKLTIMYSFNLNPLKPVSDFLNLQNILDSTIPSYFYFSNCLINYSDDYFPKPQKYSKNSPKILKSSSKFPISQFIISQTLSNPELNFQDVTILPTF